MSAGRTLVVGAGLSGLACAFDLARAGVDVTVLEASERPGGVAGTTTRDGFLFESGPSTIQASSEEFRRLCGDLDIAARLIVASPAAEERYLFLRGKLVTLPSTPAGFLKSPLLSARARAFVATEPFRRWKAPKPASPGTIGGASEPDLDAFFTERLGREAAHVLAGAFVRGVYAAELTELGARSAFPRMWKACAEKGGLVRGLRAAMRALPTDLPGPNVSRTSLLSFPNGLQELVDALARALGPRLRTRCAVEKLERNGMRWQVRSAAGESFECERVVLAVQAPAAASLIEPIVPAGFPIGHLRGIRHARVTLVHAGFERPEVADFPSGFGFLVPPGDGATVSDTPRALGMIFGSNLFPGRAPEGSIAITGFYRSADVEGLDPMALTRTACEDLARATRSVRTPRARLSLARAWSDVIPRYAPGHADRMSEVLGATRERFPGLHLAGSYVAGMSVEQVIARGRAVAREIGAVAREIGA